MSEDCKDIRCWAQQYADRRLMDDLRRRADRLTREALAELVADLDGAQRVPRATVVPPAAVPDLRAETDPDLRDAA